MEGAGDPPAREPNFKALAAHIANATQLLIDCGEDSLEPIIRFVI